MLRIFDDITGLRRAAVAAGMLLLFAPGLAVSADNLPPDRGEAATGHAYPIPATWCADHRLGKLSSQMRLESANLERLRAAQAEIAPGFETKGAKTGLSLLANYQEELEKRRPNSALASTYLAMASAVPITLPVLQRVNALLCVSATRAHAKAIVTEAEATRKQLVR